jgi:hypothetical protein
MARLIPRKQIEEQQDISASLAIRENLYVGNDIISSGSLFVSKSFFFGNDTGSKNEITGSVFVTGSFTVDGLFQLGAQTLFSGTASFASESIDTQRYAGILAKDFGANLPTLYVSSTDGDDTNDGRTIQYPLRTIKRAAQLASPGYDGRYGFDTGSVSNGYVIKVQAGTYLEDNPVILPSNTTIWGAGLRITKINAKNPTEDLFHVNSGCYIAEVTMGGLRLFPDQINPEKGFAVAFQPGAFITTSPYTQNCSQISNQENSFTELYEEIPPGGGGLYVNGDVIHPDSPLASMVLDAYTQISPNGVGCLVNGRGFIQLVSFFTNFSYYAIRVNNGGHATLNNSNISFGLYGMYASGSRFISGSGGNIAARDSVRGSWSVVVDVLNRGLDALPEITTLNTAEGIRATSLSQYPQLYLSGSEISLTPTTQNIEEVQSDFKLVSAIVENGTSDFPTLLARSSNKGYGFESPYNILGAEQITSSIASASAEILTDISESFGAILSIFANGTGSFNFVSNTKNAIKATELEPTPITLSVSNNITGSVSSSFETVISIISSGLTAVPKVTSSNEAAIKVSDVEQFTTGLSSSLQTNNKVSSSFSIIYNILDRGTGSVILPIPENHQKDYTITNNGSSSYQWEGVGSNPTITLYRGETYKFYVSASSVFGGINYPFFIRTRPLSGISEQFDYDKGVINNGDSIGNITFTVPYDAPNELYYVAQNTNNMAGKFHIINNSATPFNLIANTLTYPQPISGSTESSNNIDTLNAYELLIGNKSFIEEETIQFVSSSWSDFEYVESTCRRDIGFLIDAVAGDLLFGGNTNSITAGRFYYEYPSTATTTQKDPTKTAVKYAAGMVEKILKGVVFVEPNNERDAVATAIQANREFIQTETITFLSSSWSNFYYNEAKCKRDVGYILDAVATDARYGGNERSVQAGQFYYLYPSLAIVDGDGDSEGQLGQTLDGIRFAAGNTVNIVRGIAHQTASLDVRESYRLLRENKQLIQNETIQFINVAYPQLKYNQDKCKRDVGYIIDAISTDLLYGGIERSVTAGKYYYEYPSQATRTQKRETSGGIRYSKIISDFIVQNIILETPRIITNDEKLIKVVSGNNSVTSSFSGSVVEQNSISSSFAIIEGIIKRGTAAVPSILAQNSNLNWSVGIPLSVTGQPQITNSFVSPDEVEKLGSGFDVVTSILQNNGVEPVLTSSLQSQIKVTDNTQITGSVSNPYALTSSISASFGYVVEIISGGLSKIDPIVLNVNGLIKVTPTTQWTSGIVGTNSQTSSISSSFGSIINVIVSGTNALPTLVQNTNANRKVTSTSQFISASYSGSLEDIAFVSQSISKVTQIVETGNVDLFGKTNYSATIATKVGVYEILKQNIPFIQNETIAYLSSSWAGFQYDEVKCKRDIGLIISGAAEDLLFGANSASIVNGQFYYEYPSQATIANDGDTGGQLNQTLDGINYASRLAQKVIQNVVFNLPSTEISASNALLFNNKEFIQNETIAYLSSSWGGFDYNETTCKRDVGYIIDAVRTDLVYGGNERSRQAGLYYFLYPSQATGSQLLQTTDGVKYASNLSQKIVSGSIFQSADSDKLETSRLMRVNKGLIADEVVAYVSSSWSGVYYNESKCKRDVGFIIDAVRTDLVYGGNERTSIAGEFYYRFPSSATVGGVPSATAQLDPTTTGIEYASRLGQNVIQNKILTKPASDVLAAAELIRTNRTFLQQNVIQFISQNYPDLDYLVDKCFRDVGFITDGAVTDLVYGGNERSINSGRFYFKFVSKAIGDQLVETVAGINFAKDLAKLTAIGGKAVEDGYDNVAKIIASGSASAPTLVTNTENAIRKTVEQQFTSSQNVQSSDKQLVSASFANVITIISNGTGSIPTIVESSNRGILVTNGSQITASVTPSLEDINKVASGFDIVTNIIENGTGSLPTLVKNTQNSVRRTDSIQFTSTASISNTIISSSNTAFDNVLLIVSEGTGSTPTLVKNTSNLVKITNSTQYIGTTAVSSSRINGITGSFDTIITILENGIGTLPNVVDNTISKIKVTNTPQFISASATQIESNLISQSISIVTDIIANGVGSTLTYLPTSSYTASVSDLNRWKAYNLLKANIQFIQDETIAYLSSSWSTASYNEEKCRRDVGLIISGAVEDLVFNSNSASLVNGKFYYDYPSQAQGAQLNQTLDGVFYASKLAQKIVKGDVFNYPSAQSNIAYDLLVNNKQLIQNETIAYISSSWSTHQYNETTCKRDVGYIIDAVATDVKWGGNERSVKAGEFYYLYPSEATGSQIEETVTGITYARNLADRLLRNLTLQSVSQNKLQAKQLIFNNKEFIQNEVIEYVSASWNGFLYNEDTCKRDVGFILDAVATDVVYGGNERALEAGRYYYLYPSEATTTQLGPTLSGIRHAKGMVEQILNNSVFELASVSAQTAYNLLLENKQLIQNETIAFVSSSWSFFNYNEASCSRDTGYIVDAVATDILYGGNERVREAGEYYYLYPSLATVDGDGDSAGQLGQTLDGVNYAKGIAKKIASNQLLQTASISELTGWSLLRQNKPLIQKETIAYLSSSWTGVDGFYYNEASCSRDVAYIVDNVATDLLYGGNERSSKAGEYYFLYPSKATVGGVPSVNAQLEQTVQGIRFAAGTAQNVISNILLEQPTEFVSSSVSLLRSNRAFIQNETIQYIDAFFPSLVYNREKCRRDVGYIIDNVSTDLWYGGNERSIIAGDYYYRYPSLATKQEQVRETVAGVDYAKAVSKAIVQNVLLQTPNLVLNTDGNIKVGNVAQITSSISATNTEVSNVSSSFSTVTKIIEGGLTSLPNIVSNNEGRIKVTNETQITSAVSASSVEVGIVTASFGLIRDIIYWGSASLPDSLANNFQYGFNNSVPTLLRISSFTQTLGSGEYNAQTSSVSSSFGNVINVINNGTASLPTLEANTSASVSVSGITTFKSTTSGSEYQKNRIGNLFGLVMNIVEGGRSSIPTLLSNTSASIKVTNTPQIISGSGGDRLQARLISSSFGIVIDSLLNNGTSSISYVGPTGINTNSKITSAYNLLLNNQQMIIDETITYMSSSWSGFQYTQSLCERDLGLIISGAAFDLLWGGNSASLVNGKYYYDYPSQATGSQLDQTITAIRYAGGIIEKVVRNTPLVHISASLQTSASYTSLINNKGFIQSESIAYVSSSWEGFMYDEIKCARDIGYIVDAVATDLLYGGNERSIVAGRYYYDFPSQATSTQLEPTLTGVRFAKGTSMNVVVNKQFFSPNSNNQTAYNLIKDNKEFVQEETVAFVNAKYPELDYIESKCKRDVGFIVDAVATDLLYGGNERSNKAGEFYYLYPSLATENEQVVETTTAVDYARRLTQEIINSNLIAEPQIVLNTFNNIKVTAFNQTTSSVSASAYEVNRISSSFALVENIVEVGTGSLPTFVSNTSESIKFTTTSQYLTGSEVGTAYEASLISSSISIVTNIVANGVGVAGSPVNYTTPSTASNVWYAYNLLKENIGFIQNETIAYISSSWSTASYDEDKCKRDVGLIISGAAEDMLFGVDSASIVNGKFYFESASQATTSQLNFTLDGLFFASKVAQKVLQNVQYVTASIERRTAWELLNSNKTFIQNETIAYISSSWVTGSNSDVAFSYDESKCKRDVGYILDAVATDVYYGGNERSITAGEFYYRYPSSATGSQLDETLDGIRYASQLAQKVVVNTLFVTASAQASASYALMKQNKPFIQSETIAYVSSSWVGFNYNEAKCRRDVGLLIDAVSTDLLYGGNQRSAKAGLYYFLYPSSATGSQLEPTVDAIDYAAGLATKVIQSLTFVTASQIVSASVELLRNNREFIQEETMQYLTASWSTFDYNKEKCRRDVGYIIDGVATDLLYGGNERSVMSGEFYFRYPSKATLLGDGDGLGQLKQTTDGINYASRVAQKVVKNTIFQTASLEVSASFDLLRKNKEFIQREGIAYVSSSWSTVYYNEASCSRDIGYLIDAAATDVLYGGKERSVIAGNFYYLFPSKATVAGVPSEANQLDPTITGVRYAGRLATKVVVNPTFVEASGSAIGGSKLLQLNKSLIQKETITFLSSSWSTLQYNEASCSRDVGFIIDAVRTDLVYGGNERSIEAGSYYYKIPSVAIKESYTDNGTFGQKKQTVDGVNYAGGISEKIVAQKQLLRPGQRRIEATNRLRGAKEELKQRAIGYTNGAFPYLVYNEASCSRDTGLIVDACCTDLFYGGNERAIAAASSYYTGQYGNADEVIFKQRLETLETNRYLRTRAEFIAAGAPVESFGSLIVATGIDYSYNGSGVTFKALPPNQGGSGVPNPAFEITELGGGRIFFTSGNQDGDFRIGTGLSINQATGTLVGRTFSKSLFSLVTPFSLALQI